MGKYCSAAAVQERLQGKVKFAPVGDQDPNKMTLSLLNTLISEAESQLEIDLMDRYEIPFQTIGGGAFSTLPDSSRVTLKNLAELISVIRVLETDFGRGTSANAEKYTDQLMKRYDGVVGKLVEIHEENKKTSRQWMRRPLDGLMSSYNNQGDNGFRGRVTNTSHNHNSADFAKRQQNQPELTVWDGLGWGPEGNQG